MDYTSSDSELQLLNVLQEIAIISNEDQTVSEAMSRSIRAICRYTGWSVGHYYNYDQDTYTLRSGGSWYLESETEFDVFRKGSENFTPPADARSWIGTVFTTVQPNWIFNVHEEDSFLRKDIAQECGLKAAFAFPILFEKKAIGVMEFFSPYEVEPNQKLLNAMVTIGNQLGRVIEKDKFESRLRLLETVVQSANDGIIITKADDISHEGPEIVYVNDAFENITGYEKHEAIGRSPRFLQGEDTSRATLDDLKESLIRGEIFKGEILNYSKEHRPYWLDISIVPIRDKTGRVSHFAAIERDITQKKQREVERKVTLEKLKVANLRAENAAAELKESLVKAEAASRAKSEFLANMSHELRTPMNGMLGLCEMLLDSSLDSEQKENAEAMYKSGQNLLGILNDILDISKIEAGELEVEDVPFDVRTAVHEIVQLFVPMAQHRKLGIHESVVNEVPETVRGDLGKILQILRNLINNALKFTQEGHVSLAVKTDLVEGVNYLHFSVQDTGMGIPSDKQQAIFEKFAQADNSVTRKFGGTGLGLAICQSLAQLMGGQIGVESEEGKGSSFWFTVPLQEAESGDIAVNLYTGKQDQSDVALNTDIRVLAVDDHPINRMFVEKILAKLGYSTVDIAEDGRQALDMIEKNNYDLVLMDCQMPELDGYQATAILRQREQKAGAARVPVIALTANAMVGDREKCLRAGMDDYLSKPIKADKLTALLKEWGRPLDAGQRPVQNIDDDENDSPSAATEDIVDMEQLEMFTDGDRDAEEALWSVFIEQAEMSMNALQVSLMDDNVESWRQAAHKIKGSAGNLGAHPLSQVAAHAEDNFEAPPDDKKVMYADISNGLDAVKSFFAERLG